MNKLGGGGLIGIAIVMVVIGILLQSPIVDWMGWAIVFAGVATAAVGLVKVFTGGSEA